MGVLNAVGSFFVKLFMQALIFMILLPALFSISLGSAFLFAVVMTAVSFVLGDLGVLRAMGRVGAAVADFALVVIALEVYPGAFPHPLGRIALTAAAVTAGEILLHNYLPGGHRRPL